MLLNFHHNQHFRQHTLKLLYFKQKSLLPLVLLLLRLVPLLKIQHFRQIFLQLEKLPMPVILTIHHRLLLRPFDRFPLILFSLLEHSDTLFQVKPFPHRLAQGVVLSLYSLASTDLIFQ